MKCSIGSCIRTSNHTRGLLLGLSIDITQLCAIKYAFELGISPSRLLDPIPHCLV